MIHGFMVISSRLRLTFFTMGILRKRELQMVYFCFFFSKKKPQFVKFSCKHQMLIVLIVLVILLVIVNTCYYALKCHHYGNNFDCDKAW